MRGAYGAMAERYIELVGGDGAIHEDDLALITRHLAIRPGRVLDVGCGPGHLTAHLRSMGVDATGVDPVPEFIDHARRTYPDGRYELGSMERLDAADCSVAGVLAWYSLIHIVPSELDAALAELRRVIAGGGTLVAGFFDGDHVEAFDHKVTTAYYWPADELATRLARAGFTEVERVQRPGIATALHRPHGAIAATAA